MTLGWVSYTSLVLLSPFSSLKVDATELYWVKYFPKSRRGLQLMRCKFCFDVELRFTSLFFPPHFCSVAVTDFLRPFQNYLNVFCASVSNHFIGNRSNFNCCNFIAVFHQEGQTLCLANYLSKAGRKITQKGIILSRQVSVVCR